MKDLVAWIKNETCLAKNKWTNECMFSKIKNQTFLKNNNTASLLIIMKGSSQYELRGKKSI